MKPLSQPRLLAVLVLSSLVASGCATTAKDFKPDSLDQNEGAVLGMVNINYNGADYTDHCHVCFSTQSSCYKLEKGSLVVARLNAGPTSITKVLCEDTSEQHHDLKGASFENFKGAKTYFGNLTVDWQNSGGFKVSSLFGAVGAIADQASDDGKLSVTVLDDSKPVLSSYEKLVGQETRLPLKQSLVSINK